MKFNVEYIQRTLSGIYKISSLIDNRTYIGSTSNFIQRFYLHKNHLKRNIHSSIHLQRFYNKYGKDSLEFKIVEICDSYNLLEREQYYINNTKKLFNTLLVAGRGIGYKHTEEEKIKMKEKRKGKKPALGMKHSEESKKRISESNLGRVSVNKGKTFSQEIRDKMSKSRKLRKPDSKETILKRTISILKPDYKIKLKEVIDYFENNKFIPYKTIPFISKNFKISKYTVRRIYKDISKYKTFVHGL